MKPIWIWCKSRVHKLLNKSCHKFQQFFMDYLCFTLQNTYAKKDEICKFYWNVYQSFKKNKSIDCLLKKHIDNKKAVNYNYMFLLNLDRFTG